jgi:hypothetical protein
MFQIEIDFGHTIAISAKYTIYLRASNPNGKPIDNTASDKLTQFLQLTCTEVLISQKTHATMMES